MSPGDDAVESKLFACAGCVVSLLVTGNVSRCIVFDVDDASVGRSPSKLHSGS